MGGLLAVLGVLAALMKLINEIWEFVGIVRTSLEDDELSAEEVRAITKELLDIPPSAFSVWRSILSIFGR